MSQVAVSFQCIPAVHSMILASQTCTVTFSVCSYYAPMITSMSDLHSNIFSVFQTCTETFFLYSMLQYSNAVHEAPFVLLFS